jgi:HEAT repeat protein
MQLTRGAVLCSAVLWLCIIAVCASSAQTATPKELDDAVAVFRHFSPEALDEDDWEARQGEAEKAWEVLKEAGAQGAQRLKQELERIEEAEESDDYFKLVAAAIVWEIGGLDEAPTVTGIWKSTALTAEYRLVFLTAFEAARTQNQRALPMLRACLGDKDGEVVLLPHGTFGWPLTHEFLWGSFGPTGLPELTRILATSSDPVELESATQLLARAQYLSALPRIRELVAHGSVDVRGAAVRALGAYGHPQDHELLVSGLSLEDPQELHHYVFALCEYGDLRAVPGIIPLLSTSDEELKREVVVCLALLLCPESLEALKADAERQVAEQGESLLARGVQSVLDRLGLDWDAYAAKSTSEKEAALAKLRHESQEDVWPSDPSSASRDGLLQAAEAWKTNRRFSEFADEGAGVRRARELLTAATPADINLLLEVKAALLTRLSDECLYDTRLLDFAVAWVGRSRYRAEPGVCDEVKPVT